MKEEIKRVIKMVEDGKISADDATDLIEIMEDTQNASSSEQKYSESSDPHTSGTDKTESANQQTAGGSGTGKSTSTKNTGSAGKDPISALIDAVEGFGRDAARQIDWTDLSQKFKSAARHGVDTMKEVVKDVSEGKFNLFEPLEVREVILNLQVPDGKKLRIENSCGPIKVTGKASRDELVARAEFRANSAEEARRLAAEYTIITEETDSEVIVKQGSLRWAKVHLDVYVSSEPILDVKTSSGDIIISKATSVIADSKSGEITIIDLSDGGDITSISGGINVENGHGKQLSVKSTSGNIQLLHLSNPIVATFTSGNLSGSEITSKSISINGVSGDVLLKLIENHAGNVNLRTVSGDIELVLDQSADLRVGLNTVSGSIESQLAIQDVAESKGRLSGRIGDGNGLLDVSTVSGSIALSLPSPAI